MTAFWRASSNGVVECWWGMQKSRSSASISLHHELSTLRSPDVMNMVPLDRGKLVTLIAGRKQQSLLMAGDDADDADEVFMTRCLNVTLKTTEQHLIVRSCKVTDNRRLCSTFCTTEANYWQTRSIARPLCESRATWPVVFCCTVCHCIFGCRSRRHRLFCWCWQWQILTSDSLCYIDASVSCAAYANC